MDEGKQRKRRTAIKWADYDDGKEFNATDYDFTEDEGSRGLRGRPEFPFSAVVKGELKKALDAIALTEFGKNEGNECLIDWRSGGWQKSGQHARTKVLRCPYFYNGGSNVTGESEEALGRSSAQGGQEGSKQY
jgi:hypothetical protein